MADQFRAGAEAAALNASTERAERELRDADCAAEEEAANAADEINEAETYATADDDDGMFVAPPSDDEADGGGRERQRYHSEMPFGVG